MPTQAYRRISGKRVKGVTSILGVLAKNALIPWAYLQGLNNYNRITEQVMRLAKDSDIESLLGLQTAIEEEIKNFKIGALYEKRDKAADAGTLAHAFVENHIKGFPEPDVSGVPKAIKERALGCYKAFLEWEKSHDFRMVESELALVSEKYGYGGTIDIGAVVSQRGIVDIKTSKGVYFSMWCQVSAYGKLWDEHHPDDLIQGYHILRLGEDGDFDHKYRPSLDDEWEVFKCCLQIQEILDRTGAKL